MSKTLPDQIADLLIALIFIGDIPAGSKLPPERQLAEYLHVDRTSLRMALRTIGRMNAIESVQGSGIKVGNIHNDMGLDFLDNLYRIPELELGGTVLLAGLELFNRAIPTAIRIAMEKHRASVRSNTDMKLPKIIAEMYEAAKLPKPAERLADLEVELIDTVIAATDNLVLKASATSSRRIRLLLMTRLYEMIDVKKHLDYQAQMMAQSLNANLDMGQFIGAYQRYIDDLTQVLFEHLHSIPAEPKLRYSPLHNGLNIVSLRPLLYR